MITTDGQGGGPGPSAADDAAFARLIAEKRKRTTAALAAQPKVTIQLPEKSSSGDRAPVPVQINQIKFTIARGELVEVPQQVAEMLKTADVW